MQERILKATHDCIRAVSLLQTPAAVEFIQQTASAISHSFKQGGKVLIAGNGGSLCDAMHFAEELTGLFRELRPPLPAMALADPGHITCTANDIGFEWVFARAVQAFGKAEDVFVGLTTSGNSSNIVKAMEIAKAQGLKTVSFLGKTGGKLKGTAHLEWVVDGFKTSDRIQEAHMAAIHIIIEMVEQELFAKS